LALSVALKVATATAIVSVCLFVLIYSALAQHAQKSLLETVDTDMAGLVDAYTAQGQAGLGERLTERLALAPTNAEKPYYLLADKDNHILAGNITTLPPLDFSQSQSGLIKIEQGQTALARATALKGGIKLVVARSQRLMNQSLTEIRYLFLTGLVAMVLAAFFIGHFASRTFRGRIDTLNDVFDNFEDGYFVKRAPLSRDNDELDDLTKHVNRVFERVDILIKAQRDVSDNIAHETRTPLMHLESHIRTALQHTTDPTAIKSLETASEHIRGLLNLLDALLDIASAEAARGDLRSLNEINLSEVAASIADLYAASAEAQGLSLKVSVAPDIIVRADAMQMSRLLVNLLDNALKYAQAGTQIRLSVAQGPKIVVEDDGPGIDNDQKDHIFDRYRRASRASKGHGLGLALSRAIAERHGLKISIEDCYPNEVNKGARFIVSPQRVVG